MRDIQHSRALGHELVTREATGKGDLGEVLVEKVVVTSPELVSFELDTGVFSTLLPTFGPGFDNAFE